jgi:hypothetical protein
MNLIQQTKRNLSNIPGWRTTRKIVVIESDDWGAIRMSSRKAFDFLVEKGIPVKSNHYCRYDSLASEEDLSSLFEVLKSVKDKNGRNAVFTAVSVVANPDFDKIKRSGFKEYHYELFVETLKKYPNHSTSFDLWRQGIKNRIFIPQFHGREHLNVMAWLTALQNGDVDALDAFDCGVYGIKTRHSKAYINFQAAFDFRDIRDLEYHKQVIQIGLELFHQLFGYRAKYFIPTNGPFSNTLERITADSGIKYIGTSKIQVEPIGDGKTRKIFHQIGQRNRHHQIYLTRNAFFEPSATSEDWVNKCLQEMKIAFFWRKPAVVSSHRVNYIGSIIPENRERGLFELRKLLSQIVKTWPDVEFMSSDELGNFIESDKAIT